MLLTGQPEEVEVYNYAIFFLGALMAALQGLGTAAAATGVAAGATGTGIGLAGAGLGTAAGVGAGAGLAGAGIGTAAGVGAGAGLAGAAPALAAGAAPALAGAAPTLAAGAAPALASAAPALSAGAAVTDAALASGASVGEAVAAGSGASLMGPGGAGGAGAGPGGGLLSQIGPGAGAGGLPGGPPGGLPGGPPGVLPGGLPGGAAKLLSAPGAPPLPPGIPSQLTGAAPLPGGPGAGAPPGPGVTTDFSQRGAQPPLPSLTQPNQLNVPGLSEVRGAQLDTPVRPPPKTTLMGVLNKAYFGQDAENLSREDKIAAVMRSVGATARQYNATGNIGRGQQAGFQALQGYGEERRALEDRGLRREDRDLRREDIESRIKYRESRPTRPTASRTVDRPGGKQQFQEWDGDKFTDVGEPTRRWKEGSEKSDLTNAEIRQNRRIQRARDDWRELSPRKRDLERRVHNTQLSRDALSPMNLETDASWNAWLAEMGAQGAGPAPTEQAPDPGTGYPSELGAGGSGLLDYFRGVGPPSGNDAALDRLNKRYPVGP